MATRTLDVAKGKGRLGHRERRVKGVLRQGTAHLLLGAGSFLMVVPFLWMLSTGLKSDIQAYVFPPELIPDPVVWQNVATVWTSLPFGRFMLNSGVVAIAVTAGQLLFSSMAAFAFARLRFPFRGQIFLAYLGTMMLPYHVVLIPIFILVRTLGWIDTYQGLIVPHLFSAYATFLLRQFFITIPMELEEAARVDGASHFRIYWQIMLPLSKPALATLGVFVFMFSWNDFLWPLIVINTLELKTLPIGLSYFLTQYTVYWNLLMVGTSLAILPVLLVFFFTQRYFVQGITLTGIKA